MWRDGINQDKDFTPEKKHPYLLYMNQSGGNQNRGLIAHYPYKGISEGRPGVLFKKEYKFGGLVVNNLQCYLDAADPASLQNSKGRPGSKVWNDLSGLGNQWNFDHPLVSDGIQALDLNVSGRGQCKTAFNISPTNGNSQHTLVFVARQKKKSSQALFASRIKNNSNSRRFMIHLWENGNIYYQAGNVNKRAYGKIPNLYDWHMYTFVRDNKGYLKIYVDGKLLAQNNDPEPLELTGESFLQLQDQTLADATKEPSVGVMPIDMKMFIAYDYGMPDFIVSEIYEWYRKTNQARILSSIDNFAKLTQQSVPIPVPVGLELYISAGNRNCYTPGSKQVKDLSGHARTLEFQEAPEYDEKKKAWVLKSQNPLYGAASSSYGINGKSNYTIMFKVETHIINENQLFQFSAHAGYNRGIAVHMCWPNDPTIYFDQDGCCDTATQRLTFNNTNGWNKMVVYALVKDSKGRHIYANGQLVATDNRRGNSLNLNHLPLNLFGGDTKYNIRSNGRQFLFNGACSDFLVYRKGLTSEEILNMSRFLNNPYIVRNSTWNDANQVCLNKGMQLCHPDDICYDGKPMNPSATTVQKKEDGWKTIPGLDAPMKMVNGDAACMSRDARNCLWNQGYEKNKPHPDEKDIKPLVCGDGHKNAWGSTGYSSPDHWCNKALAELDPAKSVQKWRCYPGIDTPLKRVGKDVACLSSNGRDCHWGSCHNNTQIPEDNQLRPLVCGDMHNRTWGSRGYDNPNHWCTKGQAMMNEQDKRARDLASKQLPIQTQEQPGAGAIQYTAMSPIGGAQNQWFNLQDCSKSSHKEKVKNAYIKCCPLPKRSPHFDTCALAKDGKTLYMFKDDTVLAYNLETHTSAPPKKITVQFPNLPELVSKELNAVFIYAEKNHMYLLKEQMGVIYDLNTNKLVKNISSISELFPNIQTPFTKGIDSICTIGGGNQAHQCYIFEDNVFTTYDFLQQKQITPAVEMISKWKKLPSIFLSGNLNGSLYYDNSYLFLKEDQYFYYQKGIHGNIVPDWYALVPPFVTEKQYCDVLHKAKEVYSQKINETRHTNPGSYQAYNKKLDEINKYLSSYCEYVPIKSFLERLEQEKGRLANTIKKLKEINKKQNMSMEAAKSLRENIKKLVGQTAELDAKIAIEKAKKCPADSECKEELEFTGISDDCNPTMIRQMLLARGYTMEQINRLVGTINYTPNVNDYDIRTHPDYWKYAEKNKIKMCPTGKLAKDPAVARRIAGLSEDTSADDLQKILYGSDKYRKEVLDLQHLNSFEQNKALQNRVAAMANQYKDKAKNVLLAAILKYGTDHLAENISDDVLGEQKKQTPESIRALVSSTDEMVAGLNLGENDIIHYDRIREIQRTLRTTKNHPKFRQLVGDLDRLVDKLEQEEQEMSNTTIPEEVMSLEKSVQDTRSSLDKRMGLFEEFVGRSIKNNMRF